ncbi:TetR/AcrR family transcriptional regulator [Mycobacterium bourgelatii]|uniref:DNA-binding protein n=1 Tax=Mycobacterium bourgelatii TaxID=1273442 RepID=A0A7I9YK29_MYCBU|nr:TetR/AcrR family transcriptional regulator [Mycobacterium bourgelatii]MCV6973397.1 TetR/AcrR family transcriptional regulator [Mycobacterium bourgelatii]GFG89034.1 DNA-binding protein [Mycobacterium bourgelatii]
MPAAKSKPVKSARTYRSELRTKGARETRRNILDTAMRLFLERGYGKVTVADIASEAALALPTVYASAGGKAAILATLIEEAMQDPIVAETLAAVRKAKSATDVLKIAAHGTRVDNERYHDIIEVMKYAAAVDATATDILQESDVGYRQALGQIARKLRTLKALPRGVTEAKATDILWFYFGHEAWHRLVAERGWSWDDAERWLLAQTSAALIRPQVS